MNKNGVWEKMGESRWQSPYHQISIEYDAHDGTVKRRNVAGIRRSTKLIAFRDKKIDMPDFLKPT